MPITAKTGSNPGPFARFTTAAANALGRPGVFILGVTMILVWALSGPVLGFSDTWQLIINTATTLVTFLMVFIIQNTQNRDSAAVHLKLDVIMAQLEVKDPRPLRRRELQRSRARGRGRAHHPLRPRCRDPRRGDGRDFLGCRRWLPG